ncbi:MAG: magnesium transporter, partial [bacterium]
MSSSAEQVVPLNALTSVEALMESGSAKHLSHILNNLAPADIAHHIESAPPKVRNFLWQLVDPDFKSEVLGELSEDSQREFLRQIDSQEMADLLVELDSDDLADVLQNLPEQVIPEVLQAMSQQDRHRVESILTYDEDTAGGIMNTDTITVRPDLTLDVVLRYLRRHDEIPEVTDNLFVVTRDDTFIGWLPLGKILTSSPNITVREVMVTDIEAIPAEMPDSDVAMLFERHNWVSAPVVDADRRLLGRITIDDVVDVIMEDADHSLLGLAGLSDEEETFASIRKTAPRRAIWLGINLLTAIIASSVINLFEATIDKVVALAILMPIVASMGGVAGSQTLTVVIRGMALGQLNQGNLRWLMSKEFAVGCINGMLWALVMGSVAAVWFGDPMIAVLIAAAMVINLTAAAVAGAALPMLLKSAKIDPA